MVRSGRKKVFKRQCVFCCETYHSTKAHVKNYICPSCSDALRERFGTYNYSRGATVRDSCVKLFVAIKDKAIEDKKYDDWKLYWVESEPMRSTLEMIEAEVQRKRMLPSISNLLHA